MLMCRAALLSAEDSVLHSKSGQLSEEAYSAFASGVRALVGRSGGLRAAWRLTHASYGPALNELMQDAMRSAKPQSAAEFQAAWLGRVRSRGRSRASVLSAASHLRH